MKIQLILHASFEPAGIIQNWASDKGHELIAVAPYRGESMLDQTEFDALIILGGPQSALSLSEYPYLEDELAVIRESIKSAKKVVGFCLGAQLIGQSLGAPAERSPFKEIGMWPIEFTESGREDQFFAGFPSVFNVLQWHNDMPGVPKDASVLARSKACPRQIIRFKEHVYGLQCHPEMTLSVLRRLAKHCVADLDGGRFVQAPEVLLQHDLSDMHEKAFCFLDRFFG